MKSDFLAVSKTRFRLVYIIFYLSVFAVCFAFHPLLADIAADSSNTLNSSQSIGQWIKNNAVMVGIIGIVIGAVLSGLIGLFVNTRLIDIKHKKDEKHKSEIKKKTLETEEDRYLDFVISENEKLAFHGFEAKVRVPVLLWDVYVPLRANLAGTRIENHDLERQRDDESQEARNISIEEAVKLAGNNKYDGLVILGDPGAGKTTLMKYFALTFAKKEAAQRLNISGDLLPILVPLRNVEMNESFLKSICRQVEGYDLNLSEAFFRDRLERGKAIVLLDGLDEVADETARKEMCQWIHRARLGFGKCPFIVTSRFSGYRGDVRLPGTYLELNMLDFSLDDVQQFLHGWYKAVETALHDDSNIWRTRAMNAAEELYTRLAENETYQKLAINPLMLQLIALVHYDYKNVPDRRVELYQQCIDLLLQKWDQAKGLKTLLTAKEARQVLQPLALWLHSKENRRQATFDELLEQIQPHVQRVKPGVDAKMVLTSMRDRSGVFVGFGTEIYGFQHHSFQEYLTAEEIRNTGSVDTLVDHFDESWWREPTLLALGLDNPSIFKQFMTSYLNSQKSTGATADFMVRCVNEALVKEEAPLIEVLSDPEQNWQTRYNALLGLEVIGSEAAKEATMTALYDTDSRIALKAEDLAVRWNLVIVYEKVEDIDQQTGYALRIFNDFEQQAEYILIPGGEYVVGEVKKNVKVNPFYLAKFVVTNRQYRKFVEETGYREPSYWKNKRFYGDEQPVVTVSWDDTQAYCKWLNRSSVDGHTYRLPFEAEWEWAAGRGDRKYPWGNEEPKPELANYAGNVGQTTPVGNYPAGATPDGLMDMAGNVFEWCEDWYDERKKYRVLRGGSFGVVALWLLCSSRYWRYPNLRLNDIGFRVVRAPSS
jgi:hypothetical protein